MTAFSFYPVQLNKHPFIYSGECVEVNKILDAAIYREASYRRMTMEKKINIEEMLEYKQKYSSFQYEGYRYKTAVCIINYINFNKRIIHSLGLTEPILARIEMKSDRPAHKIGLMPLAKDIIRIHKSSQIIDRGMYRKMVIEGKAPEWIEKNLESIEVIERKIYNKHDFLENLKLAVTFPEKINL